MNIKIDDRWISLRDELVFGEALDMEEEKRRKWVQETISFTCILLLGSTKTIILGQDGIKIDLALYEYEPKSHEQRQSYLGNRVLV